MRPGIWTLAQIDSGGQEAPSAAPVLIMMAVIVLAVALAVKLVDLRRRRAEQAVQIEARISDTMLTDPTLGRLPVAVEVHVPLRPRAPVEVEVRGEVPTPELREATVRLVVGEAMARVPGARVTDHLCVVPTARAA
jgi:hypothetical protein